MALTDVSGAVASVTNDPYVQQTMLMGCMLESSCQSIPQIGGGPGRGPWQLETGPGGSHYGQYTDAQAMNPYAAAGIMLPSYQRAVSHFSQQQWQTDPKGTAAQAAFIAECTNGYGPASACPVPMYSAARVDSAWNALGGSAVANPTSNPSLNGGTQTQQLGLPITGNQGKQCTGNLKLPDGSCILPGGPGQGPVTPVDSGINKVNSMLDLAAKAVAALTSHDTWIRALLIIGGVFVIGAGGLVALHGTAAGGA
jgi:hypothetical protein